MLSSLSISLILSILIYRLIYIKRYRFFYLATSFLTLRIWLTIFAAMSYASGRIFMYELGNYSNYSEKILLLLLLFSLLFLWYESLFSNYLHKSMKKYRIKLNITYFSYFIKYLIFISFFYMTISFFLFYEAYSIGGIGSISGMSKFNYMDYVFHPILFKILYAINPLLILIIAYGFVIQKNFKGKKILFYNKKLFYLLIILGFTFHSFVYGFIQAKSHFILTYIIFFIVPISFFNYIHGFKVFNNSLKLFFFIFYIIIFIIIIFYMHYGNLFFELLFKRLLLEGQFLFITLKDFFNNLNNLDFFEHIPKSGENSAIVQLMHRYLTSTQINLYENTGWTMSGAMPGYNFLFQNFWIGIIYWFFNLFIMSFLFLKSLKSFIFGNIVLSFLYIKMYWYVMGYITLGENYLYREKFWFFLFVLLCIYIGKDIMRKSFSKLERNVNV